MQITITQKDIEKYPIQNTDSGLLIDELAYAAGQWTEDELMNNNYDYEPYTPYSFDYEKDLLENTKTVEQLYNIAKQVGVSINANWERISREQGLQAGACVALNNKTEWETLLEAYTEKLKDDRTDGISNAYNKELQEEIDDFWSDMRKEWLYGDRYYAGVISEISKHFTETRDGEYNEKDNSYTFFMTENDIEDAKNHGYNKRQLKKYLLQCIYNKSTDRVNWEKIEREMKKAERERLAQYKKEQAEKAEQERREKLLALTL